MTDPMIIGNAETKYGDLPFLIVWGARRVH